jgi:hypothetical protein
VIVCNTKDYKKFSVDFYKIYSKSNLIFFVSTNVLFKLKLSLAILANKNKIVLQSSLIITKQQLNFRFYEQSNQTILNIK